MTIVKLPRREPGLHYSNAAIRSRRFPTGWKTSRLNDRCNVCYYRVCTYPAMSKTVIQSLWAKRSSHRPQTEEASDRQTKLGDFIEKLRLSRWLAPYAGAETAPIVDFCRQHGILSELRAAVRLAQSVFWSSDVKVEKDTDPETDDVQIVVCVSVRNKPRADVLAAYYAFQRRMLSIVQADKSNLIGLSYDIM